jgi:hypothetical protein
MGGRNGTLVSRQQIERIVREVLAEKSAGRGRPKVTDGELVLTCKVVSVEGLKNRLDGITRVVVPRGAVITPAARDELRARQIAIASAVGGSKTSPSKHLLIGRSECKFNLDSLFALLSRDGIHAEQAPDGDLIACVETVCGHALAGQQRALLLTELTAAAICLANRRKGVRAASGSVADLPAAVASINPNVLIVSPRGLAAHQLRQIIMVWLRNPKQPGSNKLLEQLG